MQRVRWIMLVSLIWITGIAQQRAVINNFNNLQSAQTIDSLRNVLINVHTDTIRIHAWHRLTYPLLFSSPDSAMILAQEGLKSSVLVGYKKGESLCKTDIAAIWWILGDYPKANLLMLENLKLTQQLGDAEAIEWLLSFLMTIYRDQGDFREALRFASKGASQHAYFSESMWHTMMASVYVEMKEYDSAFYFLRQGDGTGYNLLLFGDAYSGKGNSVEAINYYQQGLQKLQELKNFKDIAVLYAHMARLYKNNDKIDSAIALAKKGFDISETVRFKRGIFETSRLLSTLYENTDTEKALKYLKLSMEANDSLFNLRKITGALETRYNEQLRQQELKVAAIDYKNKLKTIIFSAALAIFLSAVILLYRNNRQKQRAKSAVEKAYSELKATQSQLIQSEKMASLGELTAGIAHEIQNPLNFVNNFSDVNAELVDEANQEINKGNVDEVKAILNDIKDNEQKINHHGKKADAIVKGMLQHSRSSTGQKEPTDINALADEYLRLAYHGLRAKDKKFNATTKAEFDNNIGKINVVPQEIGRVILNLINNAFYAVNEKQRQNLNDFVPMVTVTTANQNGKVEIKVKDNGNGIPKKILDKIFQPFFTTKPTGQGTGLGLSLAYDIITKGHGGELKVETKEGEGSEFVIQLPIN